MIESLAALKKELKKNGEYNEAKKIRHLIKKASLPGIDVPTDETEIEGTQKLLKHLEKNKGLFIYLDNPSGTEKKFGGDKKMLPFHYGEFTELINPADDMGWDLIIVPSASQDDVDHIKPGHSLEPIGYVPVNEDESVWAKETRTEGRPDGKKPPVGNDKIILSPDKTVKSSDKNKIEDFFSDMWQFDDIVWLET